MTEHGWEYLFLVALVLPLLPAGMLVFSLFQRRKRQAVVELAFLGIALVVNPVAQAYVVEPWDDERNYEFARDARSMNLEGKTPEQVRALLGEPDYVQNWVPTMYNSPSVSKRTDGYTYWGYKPLRGYWLGSHFQVFFRQGRVYCTDANDD